MNRNKKGIIYWLAVIFWFILIFILSAQPVYKSNGLSKGIAKEIMKIIEYIIPDNDISLARLNHYLRKFAHFFAYMILGILIMNVLSAIKINGKKRIVLALLICIVYAITDEFHQLFVPGRGAQVKDVIIDTLGALSGIGVEKIKDKS